MLEKNKELFTYDPSVHDYSEDKPEMVDIGHNHFVYGNKAEIARYREIRESNTKMKSITILTPEEKAEKEAKRTQEDNLATKEVVLAAPVHDTGSFWLKFLGFLLPILSLIGAFVYKKHNYMRNFNALKKGAIVGIGFRLVIIAIFILLILLAVV